MKRLVWMVMLLLTVGIFAEEPKKPGANTDLALDVSKANADFKIQGEYAGEIKTADGAKKLGAQIIALGGGTFHSLFLPGGLPGAGWDEKTRIENAKNWTVDGKMDGGKALFDGAAGQSYVASISNDVLTGKTDKGEPFELKKVTRESPNAGAKPPAGAIVLFDGSNLDAWTGGGQIEERKLMSTAHGGVTTKQKFGDFTLHVEFMEPYKPYGRDQDRGNSGVYMQNRYECQVLDSFGLKGANNEAGGIYTKAKPKVNMAFPPLQWQTYDITFTAARFEGEKKVKNATATILHNGVTIHENFEITGSTGGGQKETAEPGPIQFQGHGNPVFYRNIWIVEKK